jgi:L-threonylcarbamoyladenylate synthase
MNVRPADSASISVAAALIRAGGLVAFPTETVYGLGADAINPEAVARIFQAKRRPSFDPLIVHVSDRTMLPEVTEEVNPAALALIERFWPGPLTLVMTRGERVPGIVTAGLDTVAVRMPAHPVASALIAAAGTPIAAPSANRFGRLSPTSAQHVARQLGSEVDLILDGGATPHGVESTIVDTSDGLRVLRHGAITIEALRAAGFEATDASGPTSHPSVPGQLPGHYAPATPLVLAPPGEWGDLSRAAILGFTAAPDGCLVSEILSPTGDMVEAASHLFEALHHLDDAGAEVIYVEPVPETGLGRAIMDRLRRAAHRQVP